MSDNDFTQSFDATVWAKAFVERVRKNPDIATHEGTMIGWFANALMRGYDEHAGCFSPSELSDDADREMGLPEGEDWGSK